MLNKFIPYIFMIALFFVGTSHSAYASNSDKMVVSMPDFMISVNDSVIDNIHSKYPLFLYQGITYFPMTWHNAAALGLQVSWDQVHGLNVSKLQSCQPLQQELKPIVNVNSENQATLVTFPVTVNGKGIDNENESYPVLLLQDIVYFPMTWAFTNDEFSWHTTWDQTDGYQIAACGAHELAIEQAKREQFAARNLLNGGKLAASEEWIFTNSSDKSSSLAKWSKDGTQTFKLSDDDARSINAIGEWLYYTVQADLLPNGQYDYSGIYKIRQDGTERTKISSVKASHIRVKQNWIYYLDANDMGINRMKLDGSYTENVMPDKGVYDFIIYNNEIYYFQTGTTSVLYRIDINGAGKHKIDENVSSSIIIVDGWIYYIKWDNQFYNLYKQSIDQSTSILLYSVDPMKDNGPLSSLQYRNGWIYFLHGKISLSGHVNIEKIRMDGTKPMIVSNIGYASELYDVDPFFYLWKFGPYSTEKYIWRVTE
ncbi:DUF5050 domain-containing protein [Paenibacillus sp. SYP-B3998]|uniref:DUF5050 domain-containing protein n=1 Tax=Paenibacillus sp. SYP-B3998 TaxID=2678564 RepID=A0A6G3ZR44_9BACL|nr:DUF5050 domain-containing protein [Paenibacillus sp. SYP-B3998]NEW04602.1 DUF5050 domain-containing protein [Paenibacillus sp. SYP-B3998]